MVLVKLEGVQKMFGVGGLGQALMGSFYVLLISNFSNLNLFNTAVCYAIANCIFDKNF